MLPQHKTKLHSEGERYRMGKVSLHGFINPGYKLLTLRVK